VLVAAGEDRQLGELRRLAETLGLGVLGEMEQQRRDNAGYLGRGKREELGELVRELGAVVVVADDELTASQARVLESGAGVPVVDRAELIIEIFAAHASTTASRMEVELARLQYRLPRLKGRRGGALSRLGGGGAGGGGARRGSGEQQLEYDRRTIRERMETIRARLADEESARRVRGSRLRTSGVPRVALVGYTNAGKTTILNALSGETRSSADRLFETLETTTRLVDGTAPDNTSRDAGSNGGAESRPDFVVTDTVGFIRKLPTQLVHSFASTLEAAADADVLVLCADAASPVLAEEVRTVEETLAGALGRGEQGPAGGPEVILCLNKADLLDEEGRRSVEARYPGAVVVSAKEDVGPLVRAIGAAISGRGVRMDLLIPHDRYADAAALYGLAEIHARSDTESGILMDVTVPKHRAGAYARYLSAGRRAAY